MGHRHGLSGHEGWRYVQIGFGLLLFGAIIDVTDNFPSLNNYVLIGDTPYEAFLEKVVGYLAGFIFLLLGFLKWLPAITRLEETKHILQKSNEELEDRVLERTKEIQAQKNKIEEAYRVKSNFFSTMSHELRTPLNAIIGFSDMICLEAHGKTGHPKYVEYALDIHQSGRHLLKIINNILDFSKAESGAMKTYTMRTDPQEMVESCLRMFTVDAEKKGVALSSSIESGLRPFFCDEMRLRQILINLLSNAVKFTPRNGRVSLAVKMNGGEDGFLSFIIADTGIGIAAEHQSLVFGLFSQVDELKKESVIGTGIGLSLSKELANLLGGRLELESNLGEGATVTVSLPFDGLKGQE